MKKTKIVATIGPASESEEVLKQLFENGLNVCRLNFSHGSHEEHKKRIDTIKSKGRTRPSYCYYARHKGTRNQVG